MIPDSVYDLPTLAADMASKGQEGGLDAFQCPTCPRTPDAHGIVSTVSLPGNLPPWTCHTCASGPHRQGLADQKAADSAAAGPDWSAVRAQRDGLLARSDWTQIPDTPLSAEERAAWAAYRQQLRDLPDSGPDPDAVVWPEPPA